jgi:hypothetical protein
MLNMVKTEIRCAVLFDWQFQEALTWVSVFTHILIL